MTNSNTNQFKDWNNYYNLIIKGLKVFLFYLSVLSLCRVIFIALLQDYMGADAGSADIWLALFGGTRLSIQTAGLMTMVVGLPSAVAAVFSRKGGKIIFKVLSAATAAVNMILFFASIPYYHQFHSRFHQMLFNTANDDVYALFVSLVQEFNLPLRLSGALLVAFVVWWLLNKFIELQFTEHLGIKGKLESWGKAGVWAEKILVIAVFYLVARLVFFGGSLSWENSVSWENAGITKDAFLNEAILDDYQAIYRGYRMNGRLLSSEGLDFTPQQIQELAAHMVGKNPDSNNLEDYITRRAQGPQIEKPKHIFLIVSESYANWPLLDKYKNLHIADGMRSVIKEQDTAYCPAFLPNGGSTVSAVTGIVTGLADANLYLTTMPESFEAPYPTSIAPQMKELGYDTTMWYAGPATWERIEPFVLAQGFDHFRGKGSMPQNATGSVWGVDDEYLYQAVLEGVDPEKDSFNVILNVSNHSPFNVELSSKGFDSQQVIAGLPEEVKGDAELINQLGHFWYADREMAKFIKAVKEKYPDSLVLVVGDHAERYNIDKTPSIYERYGVPFIITGRGVTQNLMIPKAAGSQIDIAPTILEMIAPKGFKYMSIGSSLTRHNTMGVNYAVWFTRDYYGEADIYPLQPIPIDANGGAEPMDVLEMQIYCDTVRSISWWLPKYGNILDESLMEAKK